MRRAMTLAKGRRTHPNPAVGAVVLAAGGAVVGEGAHDGPGSRHAEVVALQQAGAAARGGTLVVTLEPCAHHGLTPPCTDAIISAGIAKVVAAVADPDAKVSGRGFEALEEAGVALVRGFLADEAEAIDPGYFYHRRTGLPLMTLKTALTLDGQVAAADGTSQWITGELARAEAHGLRSIAGGVLVGAGTVRSDDPQLTVRLAEFTGTQPRPIIIAGTQPLPPTAAVMDSHPLVYSTQPLELPAEVVVVPAGPGGVDVAAVAKDLGQRNFIEVLVEGGPRVAASFLRAKLISKLIFYYGSRLASGAGRTAVAGEWDTLTSAIPLRVDAAALVGGDVRIEATVVQ